MQKEIRIAMLGFGNAGKSFFRLLESKKDELRRLYGTEVKVVAITTGSHGSWENPDGIEFSQIGDSPQFASPQFVKSMDVVLEAEYDVLIELTPLAIFSGQPAIDHIRGALSRGKHVITANKGPIAWAYESLRKLAEEQGVFFLHETTVMDGTPVYNLVQDTLPLCQVTEVKGILNSTTNYVLEELAKGKPYEEVIREGQKRGFVEADPAMDIEGWDAAAKTAALLNVLMRANITPDQIERKGIGEITYETIKEAEGRGKVLKLLCRGTIENGKVVGRVWPEEIDQTDLLASIKGTSSILSITTDLMGTLSIIEQDPEIEQTAYGIFSDLIRIIRSQ
jgi:homoserine dehydrogenase